MKPTPREYQGRITGRPYDVGEGWSEEWAWLAVDFDGFRHESCLLQEAKGNYDRFMTGDGKPKFFFSGFSNMKAQLLRQSNAVNANPPARLMWYFQTPLARQYMLPLLNRARVPSVYQP